MRYKLLWFIIIFGVFVVFFLSWLPQPRLETYWFIPKWLGKWTDADGNGNIRTAVPFVFIGGFAGLWLAKENKPIREWLIAWYLMILVVIIAELGQLFLPKRTCDWHDVAWGAAGAFLGLLFASITKIRINFYRKPRPEFGLK